MIPTSEHMPETETVIAAVAEETAALLDGLLSGFLELDLQGQVILDGLTGGHILTHLAREADRMADGLLVATGHPVPPVDLDRQWDVRYGADRPGAVLLDDVIASSERLTQAIGAVADWLSVSESARVLPGQRLVQLIVHQADLGRAWADVPEEVAAVAVGLLPSLLSEDLAGVTVISRPHGEVVARDDAGVTVIEGDPRELLAWASGRAASGRNLPLLPRRTWF